MKNSIIIVLLLISANIYAKITTSVSDGNWNTAGTWDNGIPSWGDNAIINHNVILDVTSNLGPGSLQVNTGASLVQSGSFDIEIWDVAGNFTNSGTVTVNSIKGTGTFINTGTINLVFVEISSTGSFTNSLGSQLNVTNYVDTYDSSSLTNHGTTTITGLQNSWIHGTGGFTNTGLFTNSAKEINLMDGTFNNSGTFNTELFYTSSVITNNSGTINISGNLNSLSNSSKFNNLTGGEINVGGELYVYTNSDITIQNNSNFNVAGDVFWYANTLKNYGNFKMTGNSVFLGDADSIINYKRFEIYDLNIALNLVNYDTLIIRNNVNTFWGDCTYWNKPGAYTEIDGWASMGNDQFTNDGRIVIKGDWTTWKDNMNFTNTDLIICEGFFDNDANIDNNGSIYAFGGMINNGLVVHEVTSTIQGYINVGCGTYTNDWNCNTTGNLIINGTVSDPPGGGTIAPSVTYNQPNPFSLGLKFLSRASGNWDDYDPCSGTCVWTIKEIDPNPIYEFPRSDGNVTIRAGHTIQVDAACYQPLVIDSLALQPLGNLTIETGKTLTVNGDFIINSPYSKGTTGSLIDRGTLTITGNSTIQRYFKPENWSYLGIPVATTSRNTFHAKNFYYYNESNNDTWFEDNIYGTMGWTNPTGALNTDMRGYIFYNRENKMHSFSGIPNTGLISYTMSFTDYSSDHDINFDGWNLIGNPYPSAIDWELVTTDKITDNCMYVYEDNGSAPYFDNYKYYVKGGGAFGKYASIAVNGAQQYIPPMQGFFVRTILDGQDFILDNSVRVHSSHDYYKTGEIHPDMLRLEVQGEKYRDEAVIRFIKESKTSFDGQFDALKRFSSSVNAVNIFPISAQTEFAIKTLPEYHRKYVKLGLSAKRSGDYSILAKELNFDVNVDVFLVDKLLNKRINLREIDTYNFSTEKGHFTDRFYVYFFDTNELNMSEDQNTDSQLPENSDVQDISDTRINIYAADKQIYINTNGITYNYLKVDLLGIDGKIMISKEYYNTDSFSFAGNLPEGIYFVRLSNQKTTVNKKLYIR